MNAWHDGRHPGTIEEWVFSAWSADGSLGVISAHRINGTSAWYWCALARAGLALLHITDFDVPVRADPFIVKGEAMWAEHFRDDPMRQWSVGNETYAAALDDAGDALGRAYGIPTPIALDLEWYATDDAADIAGDHVDGYQQAGVVHGAIEVLGEPTTELVEVPAARWHRWTATPDEAMGPMPLPTASAHTNIRAPFAFPDATTLDLVLTPTGWRTR